LQKKEDILKIVKIICKALDDKFGQDITVLDIGEISPLADYFIIVTGLNPIQTGTMADSCQKSARDAGLMLLRTEGAGTGWLLQDFGAVVVHIFDKELRQFYNLERIWGDARVINV